MFPLAKAGSDPIAQMLTANNLQMRPIDYDTVVTRSILDESSNPVPVDKISGRDLTLQEYVSYQL